MSPFNNSDLLIRIPSKAGYILKYLEICLSTIFESVLEAPFTLDSLSCDAEGVLVAKLCFLQWLEV